MTMVSPDDGRPSISRTARYKKVTKPLLERKRRARINRCLDELKDLMVGAFEVEGDNISKLEKADILELTVRHLTKLHSPKDPVADAKRFQAGFGQCAAEACQFILEMPEIDSQIGKNLIHHLRTQITDVPPSIAQASPAQNFSPQTSPEVRSIWSGPSSREYVSQSNNLGHRSSPPQEYNMQKRQEPPPIPVNQSLVCDTTLMHSTPRVQDLSQPMTGLLMTVDNGIKDNPQLYPNPAQITENEIKKRQNAEVKNVIMQKIREQILGRQVREADPKAVVYDIPNSAPIQQQYRSVPSSTYIQEHSSAASVDLRKKSKGESKHFSPRLDSHSKYQVNDVKLKSEDGNSIQEAINYSTGSRESNDHEKFNSIEGQHTDINVSFRKRHADYRNMHPKKVFLQPTTASQEIVYDNNAYNYQRTTAKTNTPQNVDHHSYSTLRRHRLSNPSRHAEYSHERYAIATNNQRHDSPYQQYKNEPQVSSGHRSQVMQMQHEMRFDHGNFDPDNEQEENMWRPW